MKEDDFFADPHPPYPWPDTGRYPGWVTVLVYAIGYTVTLVPIGYVIWRIFA